MIDTPNTLVPGTLALPRPKIHVAQGAKDAGSLGAQCFTWNISLEVEQAVRIGLIVKRRGGMTSTACLPGLQIVFHVKHGIPSRPRRSSFGTPEPL